MRANIAIATSTQPYTRALYLDPKPVTPNGYKGILAKLSNEGDLYTTKGKDAALDILQNTL